MFCKKIMEFNSKIKGETPDFSSSRANYTLLQNTFPEIGTLEVKNEMFALFRLLLSLSPAPPLRKPTTAMEPVFMALAFTANPPPA